jgi:hypothetical protein
MSLKHIYTKIELGFWQITISLLSESTSLQRLIRWFYLVFRPKAGELFSRFQRQQVIRWSAAGLGAGLILGFLVAIF